MTDVITHLELGDVHAHDQDRTEFEEAGLKQLADSIKREGLAQPITVRPCEEHGGHVIVAGERRYRASVLIKAKTIMAIVRADMSGETASLIQLVENEQRQDLNPFDQARAYRSRMDEFGWSVEKVAAKASKPVDYVQRRLALLDLDEQWQALVKAGGLQLPHATTMARLDKNRQRLAVEALQKHPDITFYAFEQLCDRLYGEQQQGDLFGDQLFEMVGEMVEEAKGKAKVVGRDLVNLVDDLGSVIETMAKHVEEGVIEPQRLARLLSKVEQVRKTRLTDTKAKATGSGARKKTPAKPTRAEANRQGA